MLDIKFIRENPEIVRENIRKKFQDQKLELVDKVIEMDVRLRAIKTEVDSIPYRLSGCLSGPTDW